MTKATQKKPAKTVGRSAKNGRFAIIGYSEEGLAIAKPVVRPKSFSARKLHDVIRSVQREEAAG